MPLYRTRLGMQARPHSKERRSEGLRNRDAGVLSHPPDPHSPTVRQAAPSPYARQSPRTRVPAVSRSLLTRRLPRQPRSRILLAYSWSALPGVAHVVYSYLLNLVNPRRPEIVNFYGLSLSTHLQTQTPSLVNPNTRFTFVSLILASSCSIHTNSTFAANINSEPTECYESDY